MSWFRRKPVMLPTIPQPVYSAPVKREHAPAPVGDIEVVEVDTSDMSKTGVFRAWARMTGK